MTFRAARSSSARRATATHTLRRAIDWTTRTSSTTEMHCIQISSVKLAPLILLTFPLPSGGAGLVRRRENVRLVGPLHPDPPPRTRFMRPAFCRAPETANGETTPRSLQGSRRPGPLLDFTGLHVSSPVRLYLVPCTRWQDSDAHHLGRDDPLGSTTSSDDPASLTPPPPADWPPAVPTRRHPLACSARQWSPPSTLPGREMMPTSNCRYMHPARGGSWPVKVESGMQTSRHRCCRYTNGMSVTADTV